ncbi:hypothetical protein CEXT_69671 [Caerostris extrusa]|uniref:Uncharacterized protein n=1 Tax=Caerostris extrusa TaxID=172846 RepID=A0AAV4Q4L1_CAEEX|nr:hypothetical protein CEXT_69671 [Caerostris extrusa]
MKYELSLRLRSPGYNRDLDQSRPGMTSAVTRSEFVLLSGGGWIDTSQQQSATETVLLERKSQSVFVYMTTMPFEICRYSRSFCGREILRSNEEQEEMSTHLNV